MTSLNLSVDDIPLPEEKKAIITGIFQQAAMMALERNCSKQISVVNDIWSWKKEVRASQTSHEEGSFLGSGVKAMVKEWNQVHGRLTAEQVAVGCRPAVKLYVKGLEYQMSGNEM
ncbi:Aristolochene synthase [Penicillium rolfsii]|nr:Aristolochene synthase [Penicillium rolfsii]